MENFQYFLFSQEIRNCLIGVCIKLGCLNAFCILTVARTVSQPSTTLDVPRPSTQCRQKGFKFRKANIYLKKN